ncbi:hypothetical protein AAFF_G00261900 [Aldrovandia affinis]|uniref:Uncharacterized protein n=1 Tax=Aldrovandia affinis TaxID=143900 RepID=A0AAD7RBM4_9TELE|nr:hypothetical protein AAFF_G00261900 [Aldrovandia affinis]
MAVGQMIRVKLVRCGDEERSTPETHFLTHEKLAESFNESRRSGVDVLDIPASRTGHGAPGRQRADPHYCSSLVVKKSSAVMGGGGSTPRPFWREIVAWLKCVKERKHMYKKGPRGRLIAMWMSMLKLKKVAQ